MEAFLEIITNLVNNSLFPIAAFLLMWYSHEQTMKTISETLSKNTEAITALKEAICHHD